MYVCICILLLYLAPNKCNVFIKKRFVLALHLTKSKLSQDKYVSVHGEIW
jgi:hypothetical protein